jgi:predicted nuclease of predicted toxin-antitoxin system
VRILIDMNLTPLWVEFFAAHDVESVHWSTVGNPKAADQEIMDYARRAGFVVFTHDLDFGNILAVTHALGPSVIQVRVEDPVPASIGEAVIAALSEQTVHLTRGALVTVDLDKRRTRILPIIPGLRT